MADTNLLVLGTSIMWGQGLEDSDKIHTVLVRMLEAQLAGPKVKTTFLAHSGASTGFKRDGSVDTKTQPRIHGEVPTLYPTILQQIDACDGLGIDPDTVEVILLDAGVNDVHVTTILNPLVNPKQIEKLVEIYCHQHMVLLLEKLATKFRQAKIFVIGYYEMLTESSEDGYAQALLRTMGKVPAGFVADFVIEILKGPIQRRLLHNCDTFAARSLAAFQQSVQVVNNQLGNERIFVVLPVIEANHAAFTADPWVFGINDDLSSEDPMASTRAAACECAGPKRTEVLFCKKASAGHPNPKGAQAYANAILSLLLEKVYS